MKTRQLIRSYGWEKVKVSPIITIINVTKLNTFLNATATKKFVFNFATSHVLFESKDDASWFLLSQQDLQG